MSELNYSIYIYSSTSFLLSWNLEGGVNRRPRPRRINYICAYHVILLPVEVNITSMCMHSWYSKNCRVIHNFDGPKS